MRTRPLVVVSAALLAGGAILVTRTNAQPESAASPPRAPQPGGGSGGGPGEFAALLVEGLKATDGCLGVETARTSSGKSAIFAWFEDAEAARRWYYSPIHERMLRTAGVDPAAQKPLEFVPPGVPVMVIASLTFTDRPEIEGLPMPISQIAIELYTPLPGGAFINGRFAPESVPVEHMNDR